MLVKNIILTGSIEEIINEINPHDLIKGKNHEVGKNYNWDKGSVRSQLEGLLATKFRMGIILYMQCTDEEGHIHTLLKSQFVYITYKK